MWQSISQWFLLPANQVLVVAILLSFFVGLLIGFFLKPREPVRKASRFLEGDKAFLKGVQYILSNDHDQAIEQFTKAVQVDSNTVETYVALANLYRSKGDIDRAIHIRRNIILRPHISEMQRTQALLDLGLDYRKGGFLDRAVQTFTEVLQKDPSNLTALREVETMYEELREWENAFQARQRISKLVKGDHAHILAHHKTEEGKVWLAKGEAFRARSCFKKAISIDSSCVDAYLHLGDSYREGDFKKAVATWKKIVDVSPAFTFLAYRRLESAYSRVKNVKPIEEFLKECVAKNGDAFTHLALGRFLFSRQEVDGALRELDQAVELDPSFWEARTLMGRILLSRNRTDDALKAYQDLIEHLDVPTLHFQCTHCGYRPADLQWKCPQCRRWDTIGRMESVDVDPSSESGYRTDLDRSEGPPGEGA